MAPSCGTVLPHQSYIMRCEPGSPMLCDPYYRLRRRPVGKEGDSRPCSVRLSRNGYSARWSSSWRPFGTIYAAQMSLPGQRVLVMSTAYYIRTYSMLKPAQPPRPPWGRSPQLLVQLQMRWLAVRAMTRR